MDTTTALETAQNLLTPWTQELNTPEPGRLDVYMPSEAIVDAVRAIVGAGGWNLSAITGLDIPPVEDKEGAIELLYHFCKGAAVVSLRVKAPYSQPEVPSICPVIPSATLYERELIEMFGVILKGTPVTDRLLLPDDWPDSVYPLRKSFKGLGK